MAIKDLYPSIRHTLDLNFTGTHTVDPRITFSRASTATYFDEFGVMRTVPANSPRIDFEPVTGECEGLLMEEQRTNLLTYSEQFDNDVWTVSKTSIFTNTIVAPNSEVVADRVTNTVETGSHSFANRNNLVISSNTVYTYSIYLKSGTSRYVVIQVTNGIATDGAKVCFDLTNGTKTNVTQIGSATRSTADIKSVGNGWYRVSLTVLVDAVSTAMDINHYINNNYSTTIDSYTGIGTETIYIWGAQLEAGSFPTSYVPTASAQATRAADSAAMTGENFSSWYRQDEGTIYCEAEYFGPNNADATTTGIVTLGDGTSSNFLSLLVRTDNKSYRASFTNELIANTSSNSYIENTVAKFAIGYKNLDCVFSKDGGVLTGNNSINTIPFNQLVIGAYYITSNRRLNGRIKRISFYPKRVSNTNNQALTT